MYKGKSVSVAMATYNGERFLSQQLDSILQQTVVPDEIVISDDGSRDRTVEIAKQYAVQFGKQIRIVVLTDNPRHGIGGNFEWAIKHTSGDYIFICGQDDVWLPEKVHHVVDTFLQYPCAGMICSDLACIDSDTKPLPQHPVNSLLKGRKIEEGASIRVSREKYLEPVVSSVLISGPAASISRSFSQRCLPIPETLPEDWWIQFCAVADDQAYFLNEILTLYRIHNSTTHSVSIGLIERIRKTTKMVRGYTATISELIHFSTAARAYLKSNGIDTSAYKAAFRTVDRVEEIGQKLIDAASRGRFVGAVKVTTLYLSDIRYRRMGKGNYLAQLFNIIFVSKKKRMEELGLET